MADDEGLVWQETGRTELLKTPVFTVTERHSRGPDGTEGDYIVSEARDWAIVIAEDDGQFLMVRQWRHGEKALSTEFPGGVIETGEDPADAALRELREETGCVPDSIVRLGTMNPNPALFANHVHIYHATGLHRAGGQELDADEFVRCERMQKEHVYALLGTSEFPHALMAAALALYLVKTGQHGK